MESAWFLAGSMGGSAGGSMGGSMGAVQADDGDPLEPDDETPPDVLIAVSLDELDGMTGDLLV